MKEGWGVIRPGDRVCHYFRDMDSLCGRVGFYNGPLDEDTGSDSPKDCKPCRRKLRKEQEDERKSNGDRERDPQA